MLYFITTLTFKAVQKMTLDQKNEFTPNIINALGIDISNVNSYGLEYIIDEISNELKNSVALNDTPDWFGLSDLTI